MPVAVDVRLPLPATCLDCGADVLAHADVEGPATPDSRSPFGASGPRLLLGRMPKTSLAHARGAAADKDAMASSPGGG